jgi:hypothetical protein
MPSGIKFLGGDRKAQAKGRACTAVAFVFQGLQPHVAVRSR